MAVAHQSLLELSRSLGGLRNHTSVFLAAFIPKFKHDRRTHLKNWTIFAFWLDDGAYIGEGRSIGSGRAKGTVYM